jgi:hypothetical protein
MIYKILEKYSQLKSEHNMTQEEENKKILSYDEEIIKKFLDLYDRDVKIIHSNQEQIEKDLQFLYKETDRFIQTSKQAGALYDNFIEYMKEAGDLYNWCGIIEKEMSEVHDMIASKHKPNSIPVDLNEYINKDILRNSTAISEASVNTVPSTTIENENISSQPSDQTENNS